MRWETAITFVDYEVMASPVLFVAFFLATAASIRPMGRRARAGYAVTLGLLCARPNSISRYRQAPTWRCWLPACARRCLTGSGGWGIGEMLNEQC